MTVTIRWSALKSIGLHMGLWDKIKDAGEEVVDFFDGDDEQKAPAKQQAARRPQAGDYKTIIDEANPMGADAERPLWMTGANAAGTQNTWNSDFMERFQKQQKEAIDKDEYDSWFDRKDATGVVLADFTTKGGLQVKAGQVFDNGKVVDLEEKYGKEGRDNLLSQLLFDPKQLQQIYEDKDIPRRLGEEVDSAIAKNTENVAAATTRGEFEQRVTEDEDDADIKAAGLLSAAGGGTAFGAGLGSFFGPLGTLVGGVGGLGFGVGAYLLNQDDANEQLARAQNIVQDAGDEGLIQGISTGLGQFGQQALRVINPLNEAYKGALDSDRGDGTADFYETQADNPWVKAGNYVTLGVGSIPTVVGLGAKAYLTGIGAATAGGLGELTTGQRFDYATGKFESVYESPGTAAAAIGTTAIDALQMGMVHGLSEKVGIGITGKQGTTSEDIAGIVFKRDAEGNLIKGGHRAGITSLVPSDFVLGQVARHDARKAAITASEGKTNAYSTDQLYNAASALTYTSNPGKAALVTGFAEGAEEGVQSVLDEAQYGRTASFDQVRDSFLAGTAMGAGMGLGTNIATRGERQALEGYAKNGFESVTGRKPTQDEIDSWKSKPEEMRYYANADREVAKTMELLVARTAHEQKASTPSGVAVNSRAQALVDELSESERKKSGVVPQASWRAQPIANATMTERNPQSGSTKPGFSDEAQEMHLEDIIRIFKIARQGRAKGVLNLTKGLERADAQIAARPGDEADQERRDQIAGALQLLVASEKPQELLLQFMEQSLPSIAAAPVDPQPGQASKQQLIHDLNIKLEAAYKNGTMPQGTVGNFEPDAVRFAATLLTDRSPDDNAASMQAYVPRVSVGAMVRGERGFAQNSPFAATGHTADYDGDNMLNSGSILLTPQSFRAMRSGAFDVASDSQNLITGVSQPYHVAAAEKSRSATGDFRITAKAKVEELGKIFATRYGLSRKERKGLDADLDAIFFSSSAGEPMEDIMIALRTRAGDKMFAYGLSNWTRESIVAPHIVTAITDDIIDAYNAQAAVKYEPVINQEEAAAGTQQVVGSRNDQKVKNSRAHGGVLALSDMLSVTGTDTYLRLHQILWNYQGNANDPVQNVDAYNLVIEKNADAMRRAAAQTVDSVVEGLNDSSVADAVYEMVKRSLEDTGVVRDATPTQVVTAMMQSSNIFRPEAENWNGTQDNRYNRTALQVALQAVTEDIEARNREFLDQNKELKAKVGRLRAMSTNPDQMFEAIAEVLSGIELHTIIDGEVIGDLPASPGSTIGTMIRQLQKLPATQRRAVVERSRNSTAYDTGRKYKGHKNMELATDVSRGKATMYHLVLDTAKAVADSRIEVQADGTITGSLADQSRSTGSSIQKVNIRLKELLRQYLGGRTPTAENVMQLFDSYQQELTPVIDALLKEGQISSLASDGKGGTNVRDWLPMVAGAYSTGDEVADAKVAEMIMLRASISATMHAHDVKNKAGKDAVRIAGIKDTWVRAYYTLAQSEPIQAREMMRLLLAEDDVESWQTKTNAMLSTHSIDMPILAWNRDTSTFTADKPKGGWGGAPTSTRAAWLDAVIALDRFASAETTEKRMETDAQVLAMLDQALQNPSNRAISSEYQNFVRLADVAATGLRTRIMTNGSRVQTLVELLTEAQKDGQKKGNAAEALLSWAPVEIEQATLAGRTAPFLQILKFSGAVDIADVIADPSLLMTAAVIKDHDGSLIEVPNWFIPEVDKDGVMSVKPNIDALMADVQSKHLYPLLMKLLLPQTSSYSEAGTEQTGWMYGSTLSANLGRDILDDAASNPSAYVSYISHMAQMANPDDVALFESRIVHLALQELLGRDTPATPRMVLAALRSAEEDLARGMQAGAATIMHKENTDEAEITRNRLKRERQKQATEALKLGWQREGQLRTGTDTIRGQVTSALMVRLQAVIDEFLPKIMETTSLPQELRDLSEEAAALIRAGDLDAAEALQSQERIEEWLANNNDPFVAMFRQLQATQDAGLLGALHAKYDVAKNPGDAIPLLAAYAANHSALTSSISVKREEIKPILEMINRNVKAKALPHVGLQRAFGLKPLELLARFVIADEMRRAFDPLVAPATPLHPVPKQDDLSSSYYDPSGASLVDWMLDQDDPLVIQAVQYAKDTGVDPILSPDWQLGQIFSSKRGGLWSTSMGYTAEVIRGTFGSASVPQVIPSFGGDSPKDVRVLHAISITKVGTVPATRTEATVTKTNGVLVVSSPLLGNSTLDGMFFTNASLPGEYGREYMVNGELTQHPALDMTSIGRSLPEGASVTFEVIPPWAKEREDDVNGVYSDGVAPLTLRLDDAQMTSAPSYLFFSPQGINQKSQRKPLDAIKKAIAAHTVLPAKRIELPSKDRLLDNSFMLHNYFADLANLATEIDLGSGALGPRFHRLAYKTATLSYAVVATDLRGNDTYLSPQQWMKVQAEAKIAGTTPADQFSSVALVPLSPRELEMVYGFVGPKSLASPLAVANTTALSPRLSDIAPEQKARLSAVARGETVALEDTALARRAWNQPVISMRAGYHGSDVSLAQAISLDEARNAHQSEVHSKREVLEKVDRKWDPRAARDAYAVAIRQFQEGETSTTGTANGLLGGSPTGNTHGTVEEPRGQEARFTVRLGGRGELKSGQLTTGGLENELRTIGTASGDIAAVLIDKTVSEQAGFEQTIERVLGILASYGLTVQLMVSPDVKYRMPLLLGSLPGYASVAEHPTLWAPRVSMYSSQLRRAQESALLETYASTPAGKLLSITLDAASARAMDIHENSGLIGPDANHIHYAVHNATDIVNPLVDWAPPHPNEEQSFIYFLLDNEDLVRNHLLKLSKKFKMSDEKMSFDDAFDDLIQRARQGHVVKAVNEYQNEGQLNIAMKYNGDGAPPSVLFTFEGAEYPDSQADFDDQLADDIVLGWPMAIWTNQNDPNHTTFSGRILKMFGTDSAGRRRMTILTSLQAVANKLSRVGASAFKIEPKRAGHVMDRRLKGKAGLGPDRPFALITGPADASSKHLNNGDATSTQRLLEITGINFVPTFRRALGLEKSKVSDTTMLATIEQVASNFKAEARDIASVLSAMNDDIVGRMLEQVGIAFKSTTPSMLDPETKILAAALLYTAVESTDLLTIASIPSSVLAASYMPGQVSVVPPELFTQVIDDDRSLREYVAGLINAIPDIAASGWTVDPFDYSWVTNVFDPDVVDKDGNQVPIQVRGTLNWGVWTARGEQAEKQTSFLTDKSATSFHNDAFFRAALGEGLATLLDEQEMQDTVEELSNIPGWDELSYLPYKVSPKNSRPIKLWQRLTANEIEYQNEARTVLNRYYRPVNGKLSAESKKARDEAYAAAQAGGMKAKRKDFNEHFDYWVRMIRGNRGVEAGTDQKDELSQKDIDIAAVAIRDNLKHGMPPTFRGVVRLPLEELRWMHGKGWRVRAFTDEANPASVHNIERAQSWTHAVDSAANWLFNKSQEIWPEFTIDNDAVLHGYAHETETVLDLPASRNPIVANELVLKGYDRALSLDPSMNTMLQDPAFHERVANRPLRELGGQAIQDVMLEPIITDQLHASINDHLSHWHRGANAPQPRQQNLDEYRENGILIPGTNAKAAAFMRPILGVSFVMRALNPALPVAGLLEVGWRKSVWNMTDLISGTAYTGMLGRLQNKLMNNHWLSPIAAGLGFSPPFTPNQAAAIETWAQNEGEQSVFRASLLDNINYHYERSGPATKGLASIERFTALLQDLGRGIRGKKMAMTYIKHYMTVIDKYDLDTDVVLVKMKNPMWLTGQDDEVAIPAEIRRKAHDAGIYALASLRGTAPVALSIGADALIKPFTTSSNAGVNIAGNMLLQLPLMFRQYAANVAVTLPGLQGFDMFAGVLMGHRSKGLLGKFQEAVSGEKQFNEDRFTDTSAVVDPNDIFDMFIRGGVTWSGLFMGASIFGGLGLTGEDDETKRRRKLAALQGAPVARDPRALENDFRNADALFFDWIPGFGQYFQQETQDGGVTRAIAKPHWMLKAFLDPVVGIERWSETGDIRQVGWGFKSAFSSFPLINGSMLRDANETFHELSNEGLEAAGASTKQQDQLHGLTLFGNAVSYYQKMLMENAFVNSLYIGKDEYDRDPYVLPMRDSDGEIQRDTQLNPRKTDALQYFVDDEGKTQQGYISQSDTNAQLRVMTENRFSLAIVSSLFSNLVGNGDSYMRQDMAVKVRNYDRQETTQAEAEAALLGLSIAGGVLDQNKSGTATSAKNAQYQQAMLLSFLDEDGDEILSKEGALAVYTGLVKGGVDLNDESLQNIYIDYDTRVEIQKDWMTRIVQQGVDLGLTKDTALTRAKSIWNGPSDGSATGFSDILWSKSIPYSKTVGYQQLNTTYIMGPDGMPWATGFKRTTLMGALGLAPLSSANLDSNLGVDDRLNSTDDVVGINTGQRGLKRFETSLNVPTDAEIGQSIVDAIEDIKLNSFGQGYGGFGGYGGGYGGGGGGGYAQRPVNSYGDMARWVNKNFDPVVLRTPYADNSYSIRTDDVRTDTSPIRRERISSERGRLTQWQ